MATIWYLATKGEGQGLYEWTKDYEGQSRRPAIRWTEYDQTGPPAIYITHMRSNSTRSEHDDEDGVVQVKEKDYGAVALGGGWKWEHNP